MTQEIIKERMALMQAYLDGQTIQSRYMVDDNWTDDSDPLFDWSRFDYRTKPAPWRAERGCLYHFIDSDGVVEDTWESFTVVDDARYEIGNYFATQEDAQPYLEEVKAVFSKRREA